MRRNKVSVTTSRMKGTALSAKKPTLSLDLDTFHGVTNYAFRYCKATFIPKWHGRRGTSHMTRGKWQGDFRPGYTWHVSLLSSQNGIIK